MLPSSSEKGFLGLNRLGMNLQCHSLSHSVKLPMHYILKSILCHLFGILSVNIFGGVKLVIIRGGNYYIGLINSIFWKGNREDNELQSLMFTVLPAK